MSAFIVSKRHIDALVSAGVAYGLVDNENLVGESLMKENVASVSARYSHIKGVLPGPTKRYYNKAYRFKANLQAPMTLVKNIGCYEYQSCEHPQWETSFAKDYCERLEAKILNAQGWSREALYNLPAYNNAPWGID